MTTPSTSQQDYRVTLAAFEGPLDLLLFLVRRAEVDLQDIPIAQITDQYLEILRQVQEVDLDIEEAGEFLVMAATLIEIKSRAISPPEAADHEEEDGEAGVDPRDELIRQLLAYQRIRTAGEALLARRDEHHSRATVVIRGERQETSEPDFSLELEDVHCMDLAEAYERIAAAIDFRHLGDHVVELDDTPIALYEEDLVDRLQRRAGQALTLQDAFAGQLPAQRLGMFLAVLELVRCERVCFEQDADGPIQLKLRELEVRSSSSDDSIGGEASQQLS